MTLSLVALGWGDDLDDAYARHDRPDRRPARVARAEGGVCTVLGRDGVARASLDGALLAAAAPDAARLPCTGDWVVLRAWPDQRSTIEAVLPRRTVLRGAAGQPAIAANLDQVAVLLAADRLHQPAWVRRVVGLVVACGAAPVVVLTKADRIPRPAAVAARLAELTGAVPLVVSATTGRGVRRLRAMIAPGVTLGLLGELSCGASTLVNRMAGATVLGAHPLLPLPGGGLVLGPCRIGGDQAKVGDLRLAWR